MGVKDRYLNNLHRNDPVRHADDKDKTGVVVSTVGNKVAVRWEDGEEETVRSGDLVLTSSRFGSRRQR